MPRGREGEGGREKGEGREGEEGGGGRRGKVENVGSGREWEPPMGAPIAPSKILACTRPCSHVEWMLL
jgi:hypothetical protein